MKKIAGVVATVSLVAASASVQSADVRQQNSEWFKAGQETIQQKLARETNTSRAKNVILMVADGNGVGTNYATRLWQGQQQGGLGDDHVLAHEEFPYLALVKTYNTNAQTPDSAGTSTAMNAGVKTKAGVIGIDDSMARGDCVTDQDALTTIADIMAETGKSVGVVSTARITHATPAAVYAHSGDRNWEDNSKIPEGCDQKDIAAQLLDALTEGDVQVAMGGGRRHFLPEDVQDDEGKGGRRTDGNNLVDRAKQEGVQYAWDEESFAALDLETDSPVLGLFESSHMKYEYDRTGEPSLAEMTEAAIARLSQNEDGFYLLVEAGRVDHANHAGNVYRTVTDGAAFVEAVAKAAEMTSEEDTLLIVTSDHEHAIAFNGYCGRGSPIHGLCYEIDEAGTEHTGEPNMADDGKAYTVVGFLNGTGSVLREEMGAGGDWVGSRRELSSDEVTDPNYVQQALIPLSSETHSGEDVAVYARGPWAHLFDGTVEQNYIFHVMNHAVNAE